MSKKTPEETNSDTKVNDTPSTLKKMCGVIMPIANTPGYELGHWKDVLNILEDALKVTEFEAKLVSERIDIGLIHEQIVTNIYENEIVICDVSSKNPNVMFELGMRLAFDKPTIIIKDELTNYSFDIGGVLHLEYPSSLRHNKIEKFKSDLRTYVEATHLKSKTEPEYSPFLKAFGRHIVAKTITSSEITETQYIIEKLKQIEQELKTNKINEIKDSNTQINLTPQNAYERIKIKPEDSPKQRIYEQIIRHYPQSELREMLKNGFSNEILDRLTNIIQRNLGIIVGKETIVEIVKYYNSISIEVI